MASGWNMEEGEVILPMGSFRALTDPYTRYAQMQECMDRVMKFLSVGHETGDMIKLRKMMNEQIAYIEAIENAQLKND